MCSPLVANPAAVKQKSSLMILRWWKMNLMFRPIVVHSMLVVCLVVLTRSILDDANLLGKQHDDAM